MNTFDPREVLFAVGAVIGLTLLWVVPLILFLVYVSRRSRRAEEQTWTRWTSLSQSLGPSMQGPSRKPGGWELVGTYREHPLVILGTYGRKSGSPHTSVIMKANSEADVFLRATQQRMIGVSYLASGDAELDHTYAFLSRPPDLLNRLVTDPTIRGMLLQTNVIGLTVTPYQISCIVRGLENDENRLKAMIDLVSSTADLVEREIGRSIPTQQPLQASAYQEIELTAPPIRIKGGARVLVIGVAVLMALGFIGILTCGAVAAAISAAQ